MTPSLWEEALRSFFVTSDLISTFASVATRVLCPCFQVSNFSVMSAEEVLLLGRLSLRISGLRLENSVSIEHRPGAIFQILKIYKLALSNPSQSRLTASDGSDSVASDGF